MKTKYHLSQPTPVEQSAGRSSNRIRLRIFALGLPKLLFVLLSACALSPSPAEAQCTQWKVGHGWRLKQGGINVDMDLHQNGNVFTGKASYRAPGSEGSGLTFGVEASTVHGDVDGTVKGDSFAMLIHWHNDTTGVYNGTIGPSGRIEGTGYNQATPSRKVNWFSETHMDCADAAPPPPRPPPSAPATPAPVAEFTGMNASEANGIVTVVWNAGVGHPNAQLWVQVDDEDEKLVPIDISKRKQTFRPKPGTRYRFFLRDGGKQLGTVTVGTAGKTKVKDSTPTPTPITKLNVKPPPPEPQAEAAGISASEANGGVTLTWNAGSGHPNTEVWMQEKNHGEKLVFTGSKGTKTVNVKPGQYRFILREAGGAQLDTATVKIGRKGSGHNIQPELEPRQ